MKSTGSSSGSILPAPGPATPLAPGYPVPVPAGRPATRAAAAGQAPAAYLQKSRISAGAVGPAISSWLSRMASAPADALMGAAVPGPPTQQARPGTFQGSIASTSNEPPKPQP